MTGLNRKLIWTVLLGVATVIALTLLADMKYMVQALGKFKTVYLPLILALTFANYLLRFVKWQFFLARLGIIIPVRDSFKIFLSGLAMSVTPGKAGEILKSLLLKELTGAPVSRTAPVIFAERLSDGFGLIFLALTGMAVFSYGLEALVAVTLVMAALVVIIKKPSIYRPLTGMLARRPAFARPARVLETLLESAAELLTAKALVFTVGLSIVSWFFECVAFYFVFAGLGYKIPLLAATFTLAFSSVVGAVSMLPGGLGAAEGSIMGLLVKVVGVPAGTAAVATMLIRFSTLWFGVAVGLAALAGNRRLFRIAKGGAGDSQGGGAGAAETGKAPVEKGE